VASKTKARPAPRGPKTAGERAARVRKILDILGKMYPHPAVPLQHRNCWELLVATILSAQCTDQRVNEVTPGLFEKYPSMRDMASASQAELALAIRSTGFFNNKAKSLIGAARKILADFGGEIPKTMAEMLTIPGAARKTAKRLDLTRNTNPVKIEQDLMKIIPREKWFEFPLQLIFHGRALCVARKPKCAECKLEPLCYAKDKTV